MSAIPECNITVDENGITVVSVDSPGTVYTITLGSNDSLPACTCLDFEFTSWPCKHLLAALTSGKVSWDALCEEYRNSPVFNLDKDVVDVGNQDMRPISVETPVTHPSLEPTASVSEQTVPPTGGSTSSSSLGSQMRLLLSNLSRASHLLVSGGHTEVLEDCLGTLRQLYQNLPDDIKQTKAIYRRHKRHRCFTSIRLKRRRRRNPGGTKLKITVAIEVSKS